MNFYLPPRADLIWLGVDLDGTIAESIWPDPGIGPPIGHNLVKLREADRRGYKIVIHSSRPWSDYEMVELWLWNYKVPFKYIQLGKPLYAAYIDDRNILPGASQWTPAT